MTSVSGSLPSLVLIEPHSTLTDDPSLLTAVQMEPEPTFSVFGISQVESEDTLEAIAKERTGKKSNKYKAIMEQNRRNSAEKLNSPAYSDRYYPDNGDTSIPGSYRSDRYKTVRASKFQRHLQTFEANGGAVKLERFAPFRKFDNEDRKKYLLQLQQRRQHNTSRNGVQRHLPFYADEQKDPIFRKNNNNKYSPSRFAAIAPKILGNNIGSNGRTNKYAATLSQHRRRLPFEDEESEQRSLSSHARLMSDGDESLLQMSGASDTQYYTAYSTARNSNSGRNSRTSGQSGRNSRTSGNSGRTGKHSKKSFLSKSSLAASLDTGASPDEILAFGAVLDHLTKGGSIMKAKNVYQKEVRMLDKYRTEAPIEANYNEKKVKLINRPPRFVRRKEYPYDERSIEVSLDGETEFDELTCDEEVYDSDALEFQGEEDSIPTYNCDKYVTTNTNSKIRGRDKEESDWCVPDKTAMKGRRTSNVVGKNERAIDKAGKSDYSVGSYTHVDDESFETTYNSGSESESDFDSYCSDAESEESSYTEGQSATYQSYSTISSYPSKLRKEKKTKKKNILQFLKGKKKTKEKQIFFVGNKILQVDKLPDSFDDDNDENVDTGNKPNPHSKTTGGSNATKEFAPQAKFHIALDQNVGSTSNKKNKGKKTKKKKDIETDCLGMNRALKHDKGMLESKLNTPEHHYVDVVKRKPMSELGATVDENVPAEKSGALPQRNTENTQPENEKSKPEMTPVDDSTAFESDHSYESDGDDDEDTICGGSITMESIASLDETIESFIEGIENVAQFATEFANDSMRSARSILFPEDDNENDGNSPGMTAADEFEAQMKSIEEPEDSCDRPGSPAATPSETPEKAWVREYADCDEGPKEEKEELTSSNVIPEGSPPSSETVAKKSVEASSTEKKAPIASVSLLSLSKKHKSIRKRIPFLKTKKGEAENKDGEEDFDDDDYVVDIVVYNREKPTESISANTFLDPKPLMDTEEGVPKTKETSPSDKPTIIVDAPTSSDTLLLDLLSAGKICCGGVSKAKETASSDESIAVVDARTSSDALMLDLFSAGQKFCGGLSDPNEAITTDKPIATVDAPTSSDALMLDLLSAGQICCGEISNKMILPYSQCQSEFAQNEKPEGKIVLSSDEFNSKSSSEGELEVSFDNTTAAIGSMPTDERSLREDPHEESPIERVLSDHRDKNRDRGDNNNNSLRSWKGRSLFNRRKNSQGSF